MSIPTQKEIDNRKRTAKARKTMLDKKEAKRITEGRQPDNRAARKVHKDKRAEHLDVQTRTRTDAQKQVRKANDRVTKLEAIIKDLQVIDPETLLDIVVPDEVTNKAQPIDLMQVLDLRREGMSNVAIAKTVGTTINRLRGLLKRYDVVSTKVQSFKGHRADIFADFQRRILKSITDTDLRHSSVGSKLLALCHLYEKERLERDQSTANVVTLHDDIAAIKAQQRRAKAMAPAGDTVTVVNPPALPAPIRTDQP